MNLRKISVFGPFLYIITIGRITNNTHTKQKHGNDCQHRIYTQYTLEKRTLKTTGHLFIIIIHDNKPQRGLLHSF